MENYNSARNKEKIYNMSLMKQCLRIKYQLYCLSIDKKDEHNIINMLTEYTTNFILLMANNIDSFKDVVICNCNMDNCSDLLTNIFNDNFINNTEAEYYNNSRYILFAKIKEVPHKLIDSEPEYELIVNNYIFENMKKLMANNYKYHGLYICGEYAFLKFIDKNINTEATNISSDLFIILSGGIGDLFINYSLLYGFIKKKLHKYKKIYIIGTGSYKWDYISKIVFKDEITHISFNNMYMLNYWHEIGIENMINMFRFYDRENIHIYDMFRKELEFINEDNNPYKYNNIFNERLKNSLPENELKLIDALLGNKNFIGLHFFTGDYHDEKKEWRTTTPGRNWNQENIELFLKKAHENNLNIIILSPHPHNNLNKYKHLPKLSISGYIYAVSKLKIVIDIDSSAGHIASFYNIPTITLWGATTPLSTHFKHKLGFRVLRNNISIVSRSENIENIDHETVYNTILHVLCNEIRNSEKIMTYEDSVDGFNIVYVN